MLPRITLLSALFGLSLLPASAAERLFILSGQSNMALLDPEVSFTPAIKKAFPDDTIIVVKEAINGQPIRKWYRDWAPASGPAEHPGQNGAIYKRLMAKVDEALKDKPAPDSVTFVWMQGEADAKEGGDVYEQSLKGLIEQVRSDLKREDVSVVIGRINDFKDDTDPRLYWDKVREVQVKVATADPRAAWVDTDDLNGPANALHFNKPGITALGERFAAKAVELIKGGKQGPAPAPASTPAK